MIRPRALRVSVASAAAACCLLAVLLSWCLSSVSAQAGGAVGTPFQSNAFLSSLVLSPGSFLPSAFNPLDTAYTLLLGTHDDRVRVQTSMQAQGDEGGASHLFSFNGGELFYRRAPADFDVGPMMQGLNTLQIICFAKDSTTRVDYQVLIYKPAFIASDNADLLGVGFSGGVISPFVFSARTLLYSLYIGSGDVRTIDVSVTAADANAYLQLIVGSGNAQTVSSGVARRISIDANTTVIRVNSIAQSARRSQLYTFTLVRAAALELTSTGCDPNPPPPGADTTTPPDEGGATTGDGGSTPEDGGSAPEDGSSSGGDGGATLEDGGSPPDEGGSPPDSGSPPDDGEGGSPPHGGSPLHYGSSGDGFHAGSSGFHGGSGNGGDTGGHNSGGGDGGGSSGADGGGSGGSSAVSSTGALGFLDDDLSVAAEDTSAAAPATADLSALSLAWTAATVLAARAQLM